MQKKIHQLIIFIGGFFLFCADQITKFLSLYIFTNKQLVLGIFGWNPFQNYGVAFGLPLPNVFTLVFTVPIIVVIGTLLWKFFNRIHNSFFIGLTLVFWGALSNLVDRILYQATADYLLVGISVINVADMLIIVGFFYCLFPRKFFNQYLSPTKNTQK